MVRLLCDRVLVMYFGKIVASGPAEQSPPCSRELPRLRGIGADGQVACHFAECSVGERRASRSGRSTAMFEWWRRRQREEILERPFPAEHVSALERNVPHYRRLEPEAQKRLRELVQVFVAEKHWEGCGGLVLTVEMQVTIAAQACLLILELPHSLYADVESIFVYPSTVVRPPQQGGVFVRSRQLVASGPIALLGEAHVRGPVVLAWDRVLRDGLRPRDGHNVVYHEFAHKLDMLDGRADGTPPLAAREQRERWHQVCERSFLALRAKTERGEPTFIDAYGTTNEAEFFAVITEHFFDQPVALRREDPDLYDVLRAFYRQDPAALAV